MLSSWPLQGPLTPNTHEKIKNVQKYKIAFLVYNKELKDVKENR